MPVHDTNSSLSTTTVSTLSLPANSRVPELQDTVASADEYDKYFKLVRDNPGLLEWSRSCLSIHDSQLQDLNVTCLTSEEKIQILQGILLVQRVTLEKWINGFDNSTRGKDK